MLINVKIITFATMRKILGLLMVFWWGMVLAQQNDFFREAKTKFDVRELEMKTEYQRLSQILFGERKNQLDREFNDVLIKVDSMRNVAYLDALIKTKVALDLGLPTNEEPRVFPEKSRKYNADAEYLTGEEGFRKELVENFYTENLNGKGLLSAVVRFVVEPDGRISSVKAEGDNREFNKQTEIAVYLMSFYFTPAYHKGKPVRTNFAMPVRINLE